MKRAPRREAIIIRTTSNTSSTADTFTVREVLDRLRVRHHRDVKDRDVRVFQASRVDDVEAALTSDQHYVVINAVLG